MIMFTPIALEQVAVDIAGQLAAIERTNRWHFCFGEEARRVRTVREVAAHAVRETFGTDLADHSPDQLLEIGVMILTLAAQQDALQPTRCF